MSLEQAIPVIKGYWYLASVYSIWPHGKEDANIFAQKLAARLMLIGVPVFSPIAHTHGIEPWTGPQEHAFWMAVDKPMVDAAYGVLVTEMTRWQYSKGIGIEIGWAREQKKPIWLLNPETLAVRPLPV